MGEGMNLRQWREHTKLLDKWDRAEARNDVETVGQIKARLDELGWPWVHTEMPGREPKAAS